MTASSTLTRRLLFAGLLTFAMVLGAHQWRTIGGRVPMVFVALWFGSAIMVAIIFSPTLFRAPVPWTPERTRPGDWHARLRLAALALLPLALVPLIERHGVQDDPAIWLLDCALLISWLTVPYFTLVARSVLGGVVLSIGAFQTLWIAGASALFVHMQTLERQRTGLLPVGWSFEDFFRPEYRYLFYTLLALMVLGYCPVIFYAGYRRFRRAELQPSVAAV